MGGLPAFINLYSAFPDIPSRLDAVLTVEPDNPPGVEYVYSDLGLITLGLIIEKLSGQSLDEYVREHITEPLGMADTMYNPPSALKDRIAATEYIDFYGYLVHGHVHDENAYSLGGVAGHAGVFATARDLAVFAQMFLGGGRYGDARILQAGTVQDMFTDRIADVTGVGGARRGLGPELEAWYYHAGLTSPYSGARVRRGAVQMCSRRPRAGRRRRRRTRGGEHVLVPALRTGRHAEGLGRCGPFAVGRPSALARQRARRECPPAQAAGLSLSARVPRRAWTIPCSAPSHPRPR